MKSLKTLIRLEQREIDALKREQVVLEKKREDCITALEHLADQLRAELKTAERMPEMAQFFGDFAASTKQHQQQIDALLHRTNLEIDKLNAKIRERFSELKKYEIALEAHTKREKAKLARRETQALDEVAISQYVRKDAP